MEAAQLGAALAAEPDVTRGLERLLAAARRVARAEAGTIYLRRGEALEFAAVQNDVLARQVGEVPVDRPYTLFREVDRNADYRTRSMLGCWRYRCATRTAASSACCS